ncbi:hypothetical protein [Listeria newyorkensis]|uniref:Uncharacterized protein n=1 Tax=Listeria newyorkensis TaxID=1497681 RepID=A0A841Z158_9LIST|nr:hypothetical protein [Listeria newyorkensis]MBC1458496.1 hypothetical protein [Listeria newyorkensis]
MIIKELEKNDRISVETANTQNTNTISVYGKNIDNTSIDLDMAVRLKNIETNWTLYEVQRDQEYLIQEFSDETLAQLALYIAVSSYFNQEKPSTDVKKKLRAFETDLDAANNYLSTKIGHEYYSFFQNKTDCINLQQNDNGLYDIYYLTPSNSRITISEDRKLPNAFVVVYNYSVYLKQFMERIYPSLSAYELSSPQLDVLKRIYLKK